MTFFSPNTILVVGKHHVFGKTEYDTLGDALRMPVHCT
jgi:hypothetical protein